MGEPGDGTGSWASNSISSHEGGVQMIHGDNEVLLRVSKMHKVRGDAKREVRIEIPEFIVMPQEFVAVVGENGCGKSTLLDMLGLILTPDHIEEYVLNVGLPIDLRSLSMGEKIGVRRKYFAYALQRGGLLEFLSIIENIRFAARLKHRPSVLIEDLVKRLGLGDVQNKRPGKASGGERQKAVIASALVQGPRLILADEPTSFLDPSSAGELMKTFRYLAIETFGASLVMVTHAQELVQGYADVIYRFQSRLESNSLLRSVLNLERGRNGVGYGGTHVPQ